MAAKQITYDKSGLNDRQLQRVDYLIRTQGYDAKKAAALANEFRKKNPVTPVSVNPSVDPATNLTPSGATPNVTGPTVDPETGGVSYEELLNDIKTPTAADAFQKAYDANYATMTKDLQKNKSFDLEQQKQELANRGIPYDPSDPTSLYGRTVQGVNSRYDALDQEAKNASILTGNNSLATQAGIDDAAAKNALAAAGLAADATGRIIDRETNKVLTREEIAARKQMARDQIAAANKNRGGGGSSGGGGGGGASTGGGFSIGGSIVE